MREELEGENVETTEDQPMETESRRIKDVGTQTMLSGDVFQSNYEYTKPQQWPATKFAPW